MSLPNDVPSSRDVDEALFERGVHRGKTVDGDAVFHQGPVELGNLVYQEIDLLWSELSDGSYQGTLLCTAKYKARDKVGGVLLQQFDRTVKRAQGIAVQPAAALRGDLFQ